MSIKNKTEGIRTSGQLNTEQPTVISMDFTMAELEAPSYGILSLIEKTTQAKILVPDGKVHTSIDEYCTKLQDLNQDLPLQVINF